MIKAIYLGGGCFWGLEELFRAVPGVVDLKVGYSGGKTQNPTYSNHEGHAEVLKIDYDTTVTSFTKLLDFFFQVHNPTTVNQQGNDIGTSYRSVIFYENDDQKAQAQAFINIVDESQRWTNPVVTRLEKFERFYQAEDYHQNYLQKNPGGYTCHYQRFGSYV